MLTNALGISQPGVVACVGAGGKTSLLQSLAGCAGERRQPVIVTSTTKMYCSQVAGYTLVLSDSDAAGAMGVVQALATGKTVAWFSRQDGDKVVGVPPVWVDKLAGSAPHAWILVEADGARGRLLKAPAPHEPVVPAGTHFTVGVLNLAVIGRPLSPANTHRLALVAKIINKQAGELVEWRDLACLAVHEQGIFQYARGTKILLLAGGGEVPKGVARRLAGYANLAGAGIARLVVTAGYGRLMRPVEVYEL